MSSKIASVIPVRSLVAKSFLVQGERTIIVDTGNPGHAPRIMRAMQRAGIAPGDVSLILLTHGHVDHFGSVHELKAHTGAPVAIHAADAPALRSGANPPIVPRCAFGQLIHPFFAHRRIRPCEPDLLLDEHTNLAPFGLAGRIIPTPGHTPGSVSLLLPLGDLLAGDLLVGGFVGGHLAPARPAWPYFYDDQDQLRASVRAVLALPLTRMHVGHGGPLAAGDILGWFRTA